MKKTARILQITLRRAAVLAAGCAVVAPALVAHPAQAAPYAGRLPAPTFGGYDNDRRYDDNNRRYDDDDHYDSDRRVPATIDGIVTHDLDGERFEVRGYNGHLYQVRARSFEPSRLSRGDRVRLQGFFRDSRYSDDTFVAERIEIIRDQRPGSGPYGGGYSGGYGNGGGYGGGYNSGLLAGVVVREFTDDRFDLRTYDGHIVRVEPRDHVNLDSHGEGDRVQVRGYFHNGRFIASDLDVEHHDGRRLR